MRDRSEALRALAGLLRVGIPLRDALVAWPEQDPAEGLRADVERVGRRLRLGAGAAPALGALRDSFGADADALGAMVSIVARTGGDAAAMVDGLADAVEARAAALAGARSAASGARVSARLVAGLPLAFLPVAPLTRAPLLDPTGILLLLLGGGLAIVGMTWMSRLLPAPPDGDDAAATFADLVAAVLRGGAGLSGALAASAEAAAPLAEDLARVKRFVRLGASWPAALQRSPHEGLQAIGVVLERARSLGLPVGEALRVWARRRRGDIEREFESATRRAGVLMMIPLATCVLPSFILLAVAPLLRGLATG